MPDLATNPIADVLDVRRWHFAIGGLDTQQDLLSIGGPLSLRRLKSFPTADHLARSLESLPVAGAMAEYGEDRIRHELVIDAELFEDNPQRIFPTANALLAALRIRTRSEIICPAVCEHSWENLPTVPQNGCRAYHLERGLSAGGSIEPRRLVPDDLDWVRHHLGTIVELTEDESFQTAVEALCTYMLAGSDRMKVAQLWAGIEAIFDLQYELRYRLSILAARLLEKPGPACRRVYREMLDLYNERSKVVHGKRVSEEKVREHIVAIRGRLAQILTCLVERGGVPTEDEFQELLFET